MMAGSSIKGRDTAPEHAVRRVTHWMDLRLRLHRKSPTARPDLAFPRRPKINWFSTWHHGCEAE